MTAKDIPQLKKNIKKMFEEKEFATYALCQAYAAKALQNFRRFQVFNTFWNNQTNTAYNAVFSDAFDVDGEIGWFIAHAVEYGVYLELSNDRKHEALRPIVEDLKPDFLKALRRIWI